MYLMDLGIIILHNVTKVITIGGLVILALILIIMLIMRVLKKNE